VKACPEYDLLLPLRASGALAADEAARVEAHLAACAGCRAEAEADAALLQAVRLTAVSPAEREVMVELPARTVGAFRAMERSRVRARRGVVVTFAAAAAVLLAVAVPGVMRWGSDPTPTPTTTTTATTTATTTSTSTSTATPTWASPDIDALWDDTDVLAVQPASYAAADDDDELALTDAALAAWDDAGL